MDYISALNAGARPEEIYKELEKRGAKLDYMGALKAGANPLEVMKEMASMIPAPYETPQDVGYVGGNIQKGLAQAQQITGGILRYAGADKAGSQMEGYAERKLGAYEQALPSMKRKDIKGVGSAAKMMGQEVMKAAPSSVPSIGGALVGGVIGSRFGLGKVGATVGASIGSFIPNLAMETGIITNEIEDIDGKRLGVLPAAATAASLDTVSDLVTVGATGLGKLATGITSKLAKKETIDLLGVGTAKKSLLKKVATGTAALAGAGLVEASTESMQSPLEAWGADKQVFKKGMQFTDDIDKNILGAATGGMIGAENYTPEMKDEMTESFVAGGMAGVGLGGAGKAVSYAGEKALDAFAPKPKVEDKQTEVSLTGKTYAETAQVKNEIGSRIMSELEALGYPREYINSSKEDKIRLMSILRQANTKKVEADLNKFRDDFHKRNAPVLEQINAIKQQHMANQIAEDEAQRKAVEQVSLEKFASRHEKSKINIPQLRLSKDSELDEARKKAEAYLATWNPEDSHYRDTEEIKKEKNGNVKIKLTAKQHAYIGKAKAENLIREIDKHKEWKAKEAERKTKATDEEFTARINNVFNTVNATKPDGQKIDKNAEIVEVAKTLGLVGTYKEQTNENKIKLVKAIENKHGVKWEQPKKVWAAQKPKESKGEAKVPSTILTREIAYLTEEHANKAITLNKWTNAKVVKKDGQWKAVPVGQGETVAAAAQGGAAPSTGVKEIKVNTKRPTDAKEIQLMQEEANPKDFPHYTDEDFVKAKAYQQEYIDDLDEQIKTATDEGDLAHVARLATKKQRKVDKYNEIDKAHKNIGKPQDTGTIEDAVEVAEADIKASDFLKKYKKPTDAFNDDNKHFSEVEKEISELLKGKISDENRKKLSELKDGIISEAIGEPVETEKPELTARDIEKANRDKLLVENYDEMTNEELVQRKDDIENDDVIYWELKKSLVKNIDDELYNRMNAEKPEKSFDELVEDAEAKGEPVFKKDKVKPSFNKLTKEQLAKMSKEEVLDEVPIDDLNDILNEMSGVKRHVAQAQQEVIKETLSTKAIKGLSKLDAVLESMKTPEEKGRETLFSAVDPFGILFAIKPAKWKNAVIDVAQFMIRTAKDGLITYQKFSDYLISKHSPMIVPYIDSMWNTATRIFTHRFGNRDDHKEHFKAEDKKKYAIQDKLENKYKAYTEKDITDAITAKEDKKKFDEFDERDVSEQEKKELHDAIRDEIASKRFEELNVGESTGYIEGLSIAEATERKNRKETLHYMNEQTFIDLVHEEAEASGAEISEIVGSNYKIYENPSTESKKNKATLIQDIETMNLDDTDVIVGAAAVDIITGDYTNNYDEIELLLEEEKGTLPIRVIRLSDNLVVRVPEITKLRAMIEYNKDDKYSDEDRELVRRLAVEQREVIASSVKPMRKDIFSDDNTIPINSVPYYEQKRNKHGFRNEVENDEKLPDVVIPEDASFEAARAIVVEAISQTYKLAYDRTTTWRASEEYSGYITNKEGKKTKGTKLGMKFYHIPSFVGFMQSVKDAIKNTDLRKAQKDELITLLGKIDKQRHFSDYINSLSVNRRQNPANVRAYMTLTDSYFGEDAGMISDKGLPFSNVRDLTKTFETPVNEQEPTKEHDITTITNLAKDIREFIASSDNLNTVLGFESEFVESIGLEPLTVADKEAIRERWTDLSHASQLIAIKLRKEQEAIQDEWDKITEKYKKEDEYKKLKFSRKMEAEKSNVLAKYAQSSKKAEAFRKLAVIVEDAFLGITANKLYEFRDTHRNFKDINSKRYEMFKKNYEKIEKTFAGFGVNAGAKEYKALLAIIGDRIIANGVTELSEFTPKEKRESITFDKSSNANKTNMIIDIPTGNINNPAVNVVTYVSKPNVYTFNVSSNGAINVYVDDKYNKQVTVTSNSKAIVDAFIDFGIGRIEYGNPVTGEIKGSYDIKDAATDGFKSKALIDKLGGNQKALKYLVKKIAERKLQELKPDRFAIDATRLNDYAKQVGLKTNPVTEEYMFFVYNRYGETIYRNTINGIFEDMRVNANVASVERILGSRINKEDDEYIEESSDKVIYGDLWEQQGKKVISVNNQGVHGGGLAQQAKEKGYFKNGENKQFSEYKSGDVIPLAVKGNAPETAKYKGKAWSEKVINGNVELLQSEINKLIKYARNNSGVRINLPFIGLGLGEGNPSEILPILEKAAEEPNIYLISANKQTFEKYRHTFTAKTRTDKRANRILNEDNESNTPEFDKLPSYQSGQKNMVYAGVGSRETPIKFESIIREIAQKLEGLGYTLNTGDANGADKFFRTSVQKKNVFIAKDAKPVTRKIAKEIHGNPDALTPYSLDLMARNTNQVFGRNLDTPVDFLIAWTEGGKEKGGTAQALKMARMKGIPIVNLALPNWENKLNDILSGKDNKSKKFISKNDGESYVPSEREKIRQAILDHVFDTVEDAGLRKELEGHFSGSRLTSARLSDEAYKRYVMYQQLMAEAFQSDKVKNVAAVDMPKKVKRDDGTDSQREVNSEALRGTKDPNKMTEAEYETFRLDDVYDDYGNPIKHSIADTKDLNDVPLVVGDVFVDTSNKTDTGKFNTLIGMMRDSGEIDDVEATHVMQTTRVGKLKSRTAQFIMKQIAALLGADLIVVNSPNFRSDGLYSAGWFKKTQYLDKPTIVINAAYPINYRKLLAHELFHHIDTHSDKKIKNQMRLLIARNIPEDRYLELVNKYKKIWKMENDVDAQDEILADMFAEMVMQPEFWKSMRDTDASFVNRMMYRMAEMATKIARIFKKALDGIIDSNYELLRMLGEFSSISQGYADLIDKMDKDGYIDSQTKHSIAATLNDFIKAPEYEKMSPAERLSYGESFSSKYTQWKKALKDIRGKAFGSLGATPKDLENAHYIANKANLVVDQMYAHLKEYNHMFEYMNHAQLIEVADLVRTGKIQKMIDGSIDPSKMKTTAFPNGIDKRIPMFFKEVKSKYIDRQFNRLLNKNILDKDQYNQDHFGQMVQWMKMDGTLESESLDYLFQANPDMSKIEGSKGFTKHRSDTLPSSRIKQGYRPVTINPFHLAINYMKQTEKVLAFATKFEEMKNNGEAQLVLQGQEIPEGKIPVIDNAMSEYIDYAIKGNNFENEAGKVKVGHWFVPIGFGRMMNNHLSKDIIRGNKVGRAAINLKNAYTVMELGWSGFHYMTILNEFQTMLQAWGYREGKLKGNIIGETAKNSIIGNLLRLGTKNSMFKRVSNANQMLEEFLELRSLDRNKLVNSPEFKQRMIETFGREFDFKSAISNYYEAGGRRKQDSNLRINVDGEIDYSSFRNYIKRVKEYSDKQFADAYGTTEKARAGFNVFKFVVLKTFSDWLFERFIPRIKFLAFMMVYTQQLEISKKQLEQGLTNEKELARKAVVFTDQTFGEMNWDNLWMNNNAKTALMLSFRSFTWKYGNYAALAGGGKEIIDFAVHDVKDVIEGKKTWAEIEMGYRGVWLASVMFTTMAMSLMIRTLFGQWYDDDKDKDMPLIYKALYAKTGKGEYKAIPSYATEFDKIFRHIKELEFSKLYYGSMNGLITKTFDQFDNINPNTHGYIADPDHNIPMRALERALYYVPKPISFSQVATDMSRGEGLKSMSGFGGLTPASTDIFKDDATKKRDDIIYQKFKSMPKVETNIEYADDWIKARKEFEETGKSPTLAKLKMKGLTTEDKIRKFKESIEEIGGKKNPLFKDKIIRGFESMTLAEALSVYEEMDKPQKLKYLPQIRKKIASTQKANKTLPKIMDENLKRAEELKIRS